MIWRGRAAGHSAAAKKKLSLEESGGSNLESLSSRLKDSGRAAQTTRVELWVLIALVCVNLVVWRSRFFGNGHRKKYEPAPEIKPQFIPNTPCMDLAKRTVEPYTSQYHYNPDGIDINGIVWADYNWPGNITREHYYQSIRRDPIAYHRFKIIDNKLYHVPNPVRIRPTQAERKTNFINLVLMALSLYKIPDVDLLMDLEDHQQHGDGPQMCFAFNVQGPDTKGFLTPTIYSFRRSLGPHQRSVYQKCLEESHTLEENRIPKAVWRGTWWRGHYKDLPRPTLVRLGATVKDIADIKVTRIVNCMTPFCTNGVSNYSSYQQNIAPENLPPEFAVGEPINSEDYNDYAFVVDVDGIGYSGRFTETMLQQTPLIKQDTMYPEFMWSHFLRDEVAIVLSKDLSDFIPLLTKHLDLWKKDPKGYRQAAVERMHKFGSEHLSQTGLARAVAYSLTIYASKITWTPTLEEEFEPAVPDWDELPALPPEFVARMAGNV